LLLAVTSAAQATAAAEDHELFVFAGGRPSVKLRLRVEFGSHTLAARESQFLREWFTNSGGAADGRLDAKAAERAVRHNPLNRLLPDQRVGAEELALKPSETFSAEELSRRWRRQSSGRFLRLDPLASGQPYGEALTRALAAALDRRHTGRLLKEELQSEKELLARFDVDEDECITPFELVPSLLTAEREGLPRKLPPLVLLHPGQTDHDRIDALLSVCPADVSREEAARWLQRRPDREITLHLDDPKLERQMFRADGWFFDIAPQRAISATSPIPDMRTARRKFGVVADRDGDGRVSDAELTSYLALYRKAADSIVTLTIAPQPRSWFEILDTDGDGQLSVRELRTAWERLADTEARKAGFVMAPDENGLYLTLTFVRGSSGSRSIPLMKCLARSRGPAWFQAMDRNGDGCVSPREFIGTREQFRRLDRDGDGLLGPEEAEAFR
jgi:Ca2+-binding EF-hand superfamily protein